MEVAGGGLPEKTYFLHTRQSVYVHVHCKMQSFTLSNMYVDVYDVSDSILKHSYVI